MAQLEEVMKCPACEGEGVLPGPQLCNRCRGEGVRARASETGIVKECRCGAAFNGDAWRALEYVGEQDDGEGGMIELRNCDCCSSTIAIPSSQAAA